MDNKETLKKHIEWSWLRNLLRVIEEYKVLDDALEKVTESFMHYARFENCQLFLFEKNKTGELANSDFFNREIVDKIFFNKSPYLKKPNEVIFPLEAQERILGLICLKYKEPFNEAALDLLWSFSDQLSIKIAQLQVPENMPSKKKMKELSVSIFNDLKGFLETSLDRLKLVEDQNKKLKELDKVKTELINNVSHELRTPLVSIMGFSNVLQRHELSKDLVMESSEQILSAGKRLSRMIDDLIQLNRAESQGWKVDLELIDLGEIAVDVIDEFSSFNKKHCFMFEFPDNYPKIFGDKKLLRQVVDNLIINAIKYSPEGGKIVAAIAVAHGQVSFSVKDEGVGMKETEKQKVFDRFYRAKNEKTEKISGLGLGLAICKDIVETLNGHINCDSKFGEGSKFTLTFPYEKSIISD